jgi:hypothetical protein
VTVRELPGGGRVFSGEVPGRVPGSKAVYEKTVDSAGETVRYVKRTHTPTGEILEKVKYERGE